MSRSLAVKSVSVASDETCRWTSIGPGDFDVFGKRLRLEDDDVWSFG